MKRQQFLDGPAMIGDASGHRRCGPDTGVGQTRMGCAKIIDRPYKIHTMLKRQRTARQRATSSCQRGQTRTEGRVQALDVRRIDDAVALRTPPERLNACRCAIDNAAFGLDHPSSLVALDDLGDQVSALRADFARPSYAWRSSNLALKAILSARVVSWAVPHPRSLQRLGGYRAGDHNARA